MTTQINNKSLSLSILIALAGLVACGPINFELDAEQLEERLVEALREVEQETASDCLTDDHVDHLTATVGEVLTEGL